MQQELLLVLTCPLALQQGPLASLLLNRSQLPASTAAASASPSTFGSFPEPFGVLKPSPGAVG